MYAGQLPGWRRIIPGGVLVLISSMFAPTSILSIRTGLEVGLFAVAVVWSWNVSPMIRLSVQRLRGSKPLAEVA
jgi:hypothetical protein